MVIEACQCNWDIREVDYLPNHNHYERHELGELVDDIKIWVDWREVAKYLSKLVPEDNKVTLYWDNTAIATRSQ